MRREIVSGRVGVADLHESSEGFSAKEVIKGSLKVGCRFAKNGSWAEEAAAIPLSVDTISVSRQEWMFIPHLHTIYSMYSTRCQGSDLPHNDC